MLSTFCILYTHAHSRSDGMLAFEVRSCRPGMLSTFYILYPHTYSRSGCLSAFKPLRCRAISLSSFKKQSNPKHVRCILGVNWSWCFDAALSLINPLCCFQSLLNVLCFLLSKSKDFVSILMTSVLCLLFVFVCLFVGTITREGKKLPTSNYTTWSRRVMASVD